MTDQVFDLMVLGRIPGVGPGRIKSLVTFLGHPAVVKRAGLHTLASTPGIGPRLARDIYHFYHGGGLREEEEAVLASMRWLESTGTQVVHLWEPTYPELLSRIYDPPPLLFYNGEIVPGDKYSVAVVGTRRPTEYGLEIAGYFGRELARAGLTVVSGLARGIDTRAHSEALRAGGRSIAVVGTGLDRCYPPENRRLAGGLISTGAIISEFEPGTPPEPGNFPRRNRVISGLSLGTVVVESDLNGGAMITAQIALDQNREVFAVPGTARTLTSRGCHALIREGKAKLVEDVDEVIAEILAQLPAGFRSPGRPPDAAPQCTPGERDVYELVGAEPAHVDELVARSGLPIQRLMVDLLALEMKGLIRELPGKYFIRSL